MKYKIDKKFKLFFIIISVIFVVLALFSVIDKDRTLEQLEYFTYENVLILEGEPFFPIGIYSANPMNRWDFSNSFDEIKEAGFNSVHTYELEIDYLHEFIKSAESKGLKVLIYPGNSLKNPQAIENMKYFINQLAGSSTIIAWYLADEPEQNYISSAEVKWYHDLIKEINIDHLTSICVGSANKYREYVDVSDILIIDPYPIRSGEQYRVTMVSDYIEIAFNAMKASGVDKPLFVVLQAFGYQNEKNKGWGWDREPTKQEMKAMTYLAVIKGVSGIFYYTYHGSQYYIKESPKHWDHLKAIVGELRDIYPILVSDEANRYVVNTIKTDEVETSIFWTTRQVVGGNRFIKPGIYLIAINSCKKFLTATFEINNIYSDAEVFREDRTLSYADGIFSDNFEPYEVHIYFFG